MKGSVSIDIVTKKSRLKTNNFLMSDKKSFFYTVLGLAPHWENILNFEHISEKNI